MSVSLNKPVEVFYSYAHEDAQLREKLKKQLASLKRQRVISEWHDRDISAGDSWNEEIISHLDAAKIILLLISPDFIDSDYCNDVEVTRAMQRHKEGSAKVIPVILRPTKWQGLPFSELEALPSDARPVTSWPDEDEAFLDIANGIETAIKQLNSGHSSITDNSGGSHLSPYSYIEQRSAVGFVERKDRDGEEIIERLRRELAPGSSQVVALWGAGGVGKTALAAEAARSLVEDYQQRVTWISADGRDEFALATLLDEIAIQLGRPELRTFSVDAKQETVRELVREAASLIVLDNFETVTPKEQSRCLDWLSHLSPSSALITTRAKVELSFVRNIPIASMSMAEANEFLDRLVQQAQYRRTFEGVDRQRIIETAEANPLILQWVFAQIDLAQDWHEVLDELAQGEGDAAHRVFDRSFNLPLLNNGGRAALLALSLFVPSGSRSAVAEVAGLGTEKSKKKFKEAIKHLATLWLIRPTEAGARLLVEGLTRDLAKARLSSDPRRAAIYQRFVIRFRKFAQANSGETASDLNALESERENVLAAIDLAFSTKAWRSTIGIYSHIVPFLDIRGYWDEVISRSEKAKMAALAVKDEHAINSIAGTIANIRSGRGEYFEAEQIYQDVLETAKDLRSDESVAITLRNLGTLVHRRGGIQHARQLFTESLEIEKRLGDQSGIASSLSLLGDLAQEQGEIAEARDLYTESLEIQKKFGGQRNLAWLLQQMGHLELDQGEISLARKYYADSLEFSKKLGDQQQISQTLDACGHLAQQLGEMVEARELYTESLDIEKRLGSQGGIATSLYSFASLAQAQGDVAEATRLYSQALQIEKTVGDQKGIASSLHNLGLLAQAQGDIAEARQLFKESLDIEKKTGNESGIATSLSSLASLAEEQGEFEEARELYTKSLTIWQRLGRQYEIANELDNLGSIAQAQGEFFNAHGLYSESLEIDRRRGRQRGIATSLEHLGLLAQAEEKMEEAQQLYEESLQIRMILGYKKDIAASLDSLASLAEECGDLVKARRLNDESLEIKKQISDRFGIAVTLHQYGNLELNEGAFDSAEGLLNQSLNILQNLKAKKAIAECLETLGKLRVAQNVFDEAATFFQEALDLAQPIGDQARIADVKYSYANLEKKRKNLTGATKLLRESLQIFEALRFPKAENVKEDLRKIEDSTGADIA